MPGVDFYAKMGLGLFGNAKTSDCIKQSKSSAHRKASYKHTSNRDTGSNSGKAIWTIKSNQKILIHIICLY